MWPALEDGGLFAAAGMGLLWTRSNVAALSLLYAESTCRLGVDFRGWVDNRSMPVDIFHSFTECSDRIIATRSAVINFWRRADQDGSRQLFVFTLSNIVTGANGATNLAEIQQYVEGAVNTLPAYTNFREDRLFGIGAECAIVDADHLECVP